MVFILSGWSKPHSIIRIWQSSGQNAIIGLIFGILRILNAIIPKKDNQILFSSTPDFSDNAKALYEYIIKNRINSQYNIVWLVNDPKMLQLLNQKGINAHLIKSIWGLYYIFRSKYIIATHYQGSQVKVKNQYRINLWHGMPLKSLGYLTGSAADGELKDVERWGKINDMLIATSSTTRNALAASFLIDPRKIAITGQPRNDYLFINAD
ncbi:MAG: CDP-glycerol glycerophosphotransferase family protein, partial [Methanomicrobiales archaeon]|nr:CDP-glycerol glycerophosphotransferase family protein [Methanomicrobiales archaeon]